MEAIRVETTRPVLEIRTTNAKLHIRNNGGPRMRVSSERPVMRVNREQPEFRINWNKINRQLKQKLGDDYTPAIAYQAKQKVLDALNRLSDKDGIKAANLETIIIDEFLTPPPADKPSLASIDHTAPSIEWDAGYIDIEWSDYVLEIKWENTGGPQIEVEPYSVEVRIRNQPVIRFILNPKKVKDAVGSQFDKSI